MYRISSSRHYHLQSSSLKHSPTSAFSAAIAGNSPGMRFLEGSSGKSPFWPEPIQLRFNFIPDEGGDGKERFVNAFKGRAIRKGTFIEIVKNFYGIFYIIKVRNSLVSWKGVSKDFLEFIPVRTGVSTKGR
ncbi:hypothetical protein TNCV_3020421 [Trichonephila clavipes]|nr:hypothetical protein TNCV_3020421 [Trichonephila clavipes]